MISLDNDSVTAMYIPKQIKEAFLKTIVKQIQRNCVDEGSTHLAGQSSILQACYPKIANSCSHKETQMIQKIKRN